MDDLVRWLGEQLDEDERIARTASGTWWAPPDLVGQVLDSGGSNIDAKLRSFAAHIAEHDPARVLREIDAKRQLIARGGPFCTSGCEDPGNEPMNPDTNWTTPLEHHPDCSAYEAAKVLAAPYADRPGYREDWRP